MNAILWPTVPPRERERAIAHELGHHDTGAIFFWVDDPRGRVDLLAVEAKADRAGLVRLIPDERLRAAERDGCHQPWEFAEYLGIDQGTVVERLRVYYPYLFGVW